MVGGAGYNRAVGTKLSKAL